MTRKIAAIALVTIMILGFIGLASCSESLDGYKATKSQALQNYADAKSNSNYCSDNWAQICQAVSNGKIAIEIAEDIAAVTTAFSAAKGIIDAVPTECLGTFYTLQEAFDNGLLTIADLKQIAEYLNSKTSSTATLPDETINQIKTAAAFYTYKTEPLLDANAADFDILKYYGTYNGSTAIILNTPYHDHPAVIVDEWITVAGVEFHYQSPYTISIWSQDV